jgi:uncharacterized protein YprB with RNaseH-like and TPR domain
MDIETTALGAVGAGVILCVCIQSTETGNMRTFRLDNYRFEPDDNYGMVEREEAALLTDVMAELQKYAVVIGHNVRRFDWNYLISRAFIRGVQWLCHPGLYDTLTAFRRTGYLTVPNAIGKPRAGLDMVADFLRIPQAKTKIYPADWWEVIWGNKLKRFEAMQNIVDHCQRDVSMNAEVFTYLWGADPKPQIVKG